MALFIRLARISFNKENTMKTEMQKQKTAVKQPEGKPPMQKKSKDEKRKTCKDNCMHCGSHCIYLEKWR